jgi:hypothetical protein
MIVDKMEEWEGKEGSTARVEREVMAEGKG